MSTGMTTEANFFRQRRLELSLTQMEIAVAIGMTPAAVGLWERDEAVPKLPLAPKLAEVYRVSESRIIREIVELSKSISAAREAATSK